MAGEDKRNRIVMINSFKGGAGKTTASLCRCVYEYREKRYHNIYYVDLDILGTGVNYVLSLKEQEGYYNDADGVNNRNFSQKVQKIIDGDENILFYAAPLNPISRIKQSYGGQDRLRSHPDVEKGIFGQKVKELIDLILESNRKRNNLIVLDCAPGISYVEERILDDLYDMEKDGGKDVCVEEIYVTTPDSSHIQKTVDSLNGWSAYLRQHNRTITVLINDLFDCEGMHKRCEGESHPNFHFIREKIIDKVLEDLEIPAVKILYKEYSEDLLKGSIIKNEIKLVNRKDIFDSWPKQKDENDEAGK